MPKNADAKRNKKATTGGRSHPPSLQVAALCWRRSSRRGLRILLITSRDTGRWVIPKGWPMRKRTEAGAAAREAWEEAGLLGEVEERSIGHYTYLKRLDRNNSVACMVRIFPLQVRQMVKNYPENGQRRIKWFSPEKAARRVSETELAALIRAFDPDAPIAAEPEPDLDLAPNSLSEAIEPEEPTAPQERDADPQILDDAGDAAPILQTAAAVAR